MKTIITILAAVCVLSAQEPVPLHINPSSTFLASTSDARVVIDNGPTFITFQCGIQVNCKTAEVKIPDGMTLDEASRKFWIGLAEAYPGVREAWVSGYLAGKR